jgi:hypothetical protein
MKKLFITLAVTLVCVGAFAQGKLSFANDSTRLVYFSTDVTKLNTGDAAKANNAVTAALISSLSGAPSWTVALWGGTSANSLTLQTVATGWSAAAGRWTAANTTFASLGTTTPAFFQIQIYDSRATSAADAWNHVGWYAGETAVFTALPQPSSYNPIYQSATPVSSTWTAGAVTGIVGGNGTGAIEMYAIVPEPGTFALAGLGMATLLIFRRRK